MDCYETARIVGRNGAFRKVDAQLMQIFDRALRHSIECGRGFKWEEKCMICLLVDGDKG